MVILIPFCFPMVDKNVRYLADKQFRHPHSERKTGVIFVSFNGVYCLPRHTQLPGQFTLAPPSCLAIVFQTVFQLALLDDKSSLQFEHLPVKKSCHLRKIGCLVGDCCYWFRCPYSGQTAFHPILAEAVRPRTTTLRTSDSCANIVKWKGNIFWQLCLALLSQVSLSRRG